MRRHHPAMRVSTLRGSQIGLALLLWLVLAAGCGSRDTARRARAEPTVESGTPVQLSPGQVFHFVDHFQGGEAPPGLRLGGDGYQHLALGQAHHPVLCAPAPYAIRQEMRVPEGSVLRTGFGLVPGEATPPDGGVRFSVRARRADSTTVLLSKEVKWEPTGVASDWPLFSVDLPAAGDEPLEIELATELTGRRRARAGDQAVGAHAIWLDPTVIAPSQETRPNIVLVLVDALRSDHLGCYGYSRGTSPFLDRMGREGVLFRDATSQSTWTFGSGLSLLSSTYRIVRGLHPDIMSTISPLVSERTPALQSAALPVSLQGELRKAGYATLACVGGGFLDPILGFDVGFDWYWSAQGKAVLAEQLSAVQQRLQSVPQTPFFILLHTYEVHDYFQAKGHCLEQFSTGYDGPLTDPLILTDLQRDRRPRELSPADLQYIHDLYDGEILYTDRQLGSFCEWLAEQPWGRNTIVIVTADHGEGLGQHGKIGHGGVPYQSLVHVPLLMWSPGGQWRARKVTQPVALVDLAPTLLELAGSSPPAGMVGRSLVPFLEGGGLSGRRAIFSEGRGAPLLARDGSWCYITRRGKGPEELYDIADDPGQTRDLAPSSPTQMDRMRRLLASLAMEAARGCHLAIIGDRREKVTIEVECAGGFSYFATPTFRGWDDLTVLEPMPRTTAPAEASGPAPRCRVQLTLAPGDTSHVILFEAADPEAAVQVSAKVGGQSLPPERFHLGRSQVRPESAPVVIPRAAAMPGLVSERPPVPAEASPWGIWVWLASKPYVSPLPETIPELPEALREQLKALGYLR